MSATSRKKNPAPGVVVLGAGASSRMGRPKLLLPWGDTTVVGHIVWQWQTLGAGQIVIVRRPNDEALASELDRLNFPIENRIENPQPERGMFSSVLCAANWNGWKREIASWAFALGDQPHLRLETLRALLQFSNENPDVICQPVFGGRARHPVVLPRWAFDELKNSRAETLKDFLKGTSQKLIECPIKDSGLALDLDSPEDYKQALTLNLSGA